ncbi:hypothetical protein D3C80_1928360 [compost metagenome]
MASKYGVRLPQMLSANTEIKYIKRICKQLDIDISEYLEDCGVKTLKQLVNLNPTFTAFAEVGYMLEWYDDRSSEGWQRIDK